VNVYFIPGLAADHTVFKYITLPQGFAACYLYWIPPLAKESLPDYACRLAEQMDTKNPFILVGLSFGGMLAVEIAKLFKPVCTILISSIPSNQHLPYYFHAAGRLRLHKIIPISFIQHASILKRLFTTETREDKVLLKAMIRKSDVRFIRWAMHAVLSWTNNYVPENLIQIHGTRDGILPHRFTKPTYLISGGHLMIFNQSKEINRILAIVLTSKAELKR
jgi:pimeloyl-ACP methyl ester carboxylesterase